MQIIREIIAESPTVQRCLLGLWLMAFTAACTTTSKHLLPEHASTLTAIAVNSVTVLAYLILMAVLPLLLVGRRNESRRRANTPDATPERICNKKISPSAQWSKA